MKQFLALMVALLGAMTPALAFAAEAADPSSQAAAALGFLAFGTFWFWVSAVAFIIIMFACIENETGVGATVALVIYGLLIQWLSNVDIIGFIVGNPTRTAIIAAAYVGIGVVWSAFRFWWYMGNKIQGIKNGERDWTISKLKDYYRSSAGGNLPYNDAQVKAEKEYDTSGMPSNLYADWNQHVDENSPKAIQNKGNIMRWMGYWPISVVWFIISDFVTELFAKVYYRLSKVYESIAESVKNTAKKK